MLDLGIDVLPVVDSTDELRPQAGPEHRCTPVGFAGGMLMPEPGSLDVLDDDEECASDILTVARIVASGRRSRGPLRFVIASWWVGPRVPSPVTDRKRGKATRSGRWPHSPAALAATVDANERGVAPKLVAEHVTLVGDLVDSLVTEADTLTAPELAARLHAEHRFAVITPEEDRQLTAAGLEQAMPAGWRPGDDAWARYVAAGLDPSTFAPLPADVASFASRLSTVQGRRAHQRRLAAVADEAAEASAAAALAGGLD